MTEREKIAGRIRALKAKTVEYGCTEDEAIAAAEKVAELLAAYNLTLDEVEMRASPFTQHTERHDDPAGERLWKPAAAISELTGAVWWKSRPGVFPVQIDFFGFAHEVEVAAYLLEICARAMRAEQDRLARASWPRTTKRRELIPFLDGMADRLHERILALKPPTTTGKGLVVLHGALIAAALKDAGIGCARAGRGPVVTGRTATATGSGPVTASP
jgi:hypothetical protein